MLGEKYTARPAERLTSVLLLEVLEDSGFCSLRGMSVPHRESHFPSNKPYSDLLLIPILGFRGPGCSGHPL